MKREPTMIGVVPTPEWREALLGRGTPYPGLDNTYHTMGATLRPAMNYRPAVAPLLTYNGRHCLPLLIGGQPVPDGIARAMRAVAKWSAWPAEDGWLVGCDTMGDEEIALTLGLARLACRAGIAAEIVTDAEEG